jgi:hypothetical protein
MFIHLITYKAGNQENHQKIEQIGIYTLVHCKIFDTYAQLANFTTGTKTHSFCLPDKQKQPQWTSIGPHENLQAKKSRDNSCNMKN